MKTKLLLIQLIIFSNFLKGQTNVYFPFSETSAHWQIQCQDNGNPGTILYENSSYYLNGEDTIIESISYKKLIGNDVMTPLVGLRNDIENKKVYAFTEVDFWISAPREILLYDFSLLVGDTFKVWPMVGCDSILVVESIDSIFIGNSYRQKINYSSQNGEIVSVIQGIGSIGGLFNYYSCFELACNLCAYDDDSVLFVPSSFCTSAIPEYGLSVKLKISPNPFSIFTTLNIPIDLKNATLNLFNSYGQLAKTIKDISGKSYILQREDLTNGIYYAQLIEDNKIVSSEKLIVY